MPSHARVCAWMAAIVLSLPPTVAAQDRTVRDVVDLIVSDSPRAQAIRADVDVVRREQNARLVYPNPGVLYSREGAGFTEFLQVEQPLPLFGARAALTLAGVSALAAAEADRDARLWALRADATARAARLLADEERLDLAESHVREVERLVDILRVREREGESSRFDRLRAEQELAEGLQARVSAAAARADALAALAALLPRDITLSRVVGTLYQPSTTPSLADLTSRASSARAELVASRQAIERAGHEADAARRARRPSPTLFGGLKHADEGDDRAFGGVVGVSVSLPLFDRGQLEAARWSAEAARADAERVALERQIQGEIAGALEALALRQAATAADERTAGDELATIALVAYQEGDAGILELLDAVRTASRARVRNLELRLEARLAQIALERAVGDVLWP